MIIDAAGISVKVGVHYPGSSVSLPTATIAEKVFIPFTVRGEILLISMNADGTKSGSQPAHLSRRTFNMNDLNTQEISVISPVTTAIDRVKLTLFNPLDLEKWFAIRQNMGWLLTLLYSFYWIDSQISVQFCQKNKIFVFFHFLTCIRKLKNIINLSVGLFNHTVREPDY